MEPLIEEAYRRRAWHGPNLRSTLRGVQPEEAAWRPPGGLHTIRELVAHAAYWKSRVRRRITGDRDPGFDLTGTDWFQFEGVLTPAEWKGDRARLHREHELLVAAVQSAGDGLDDRTAHMARGIALHDVYHAGQVRLIRKLFAARSAE